MKKIDDIPIVGKIMVIISVFSLFIAAALIYSVQAMYAIDSSHVEASEHQGRSAIDIAAAGRFLNGVRAAMGDLQVSTTDEGNHLALQEIVNSRAQFAQSMDDARTAYPSQAPAIERMLAAGLNIIDEACQKATKMGLAATSPPDIAASQLEYLTSCSPRFAPVVNELKSLIAAAIESEERARADVATKTETTVLTTVTVVLVGLVMIVMGAYFGIAAWVSRPMRALAAIMNHLAGGDLRVDVIGAKRKDELGLMARAVQVFKENGLKLKESEASAATARMQIDAERARSGAIQAEAAGRQQQVMEAIANGLEQLSDGSLVFRIDGAFAAEYEKLRSDFNSAMSKLQETMKVVSGNTVAIRSGTNEISSAADDLSRRTEQQAASLEETAAALDEITATVRKTAEGSKHAREVVGQARKDAERSGQIVRQAIEAMSSIEKSASQIGNIIGVIDEIAFQTNLLALNAGVEAARAGDAGRGFAVVASEVRGLAQRSADAAKEIKALIFASSSQVAIGVDLVGQTGKALERIFVQVSQINGIVDDIAASAQEQATGLDQVNTAVNQMDQVTQQNAAMVEESTAASHALAQETEELARLIGGFRLGQIQPAAADRPIRKSGSTSKPVTPRRPAVALRRAG